MIQEFETRGFVHGIKVVRTAPLISHMLFADDCYIFCKVNMDSASHVLNLLKVFEKASGQQINKDKSSVFYIQNCSAQTRQEICDHLQISEANDNSLYLGLPNMIKGKKSTVFGYIKERLMERIQGRDKKHLSKGGKKSVAQTLPSYSMSVFLLPMEVCREFEMIMTKFWWRSDKTKDKGIHWMSLSRLCVQRLKAA